MRLILICFKVYISDWPKYIFRYFYFMYLLFSVIITVLFNLAVESAACIAVVSLNLRKVWWQHRIVGMMATQKERKTIS